MLGIFLNFVFVPNIVKLQNIVTNIGIKCRSVHVYYKKDKTVIKPLVAHAQTTGSTAEYWC